MAKVKTSKNIATAQTEYTRYFSDFRGVDFSSDHASVDDSRAAYMVNMYKDYKSGDGASLETIPGFREVGRYNKINGIHVLGNHIYLHDETMLRFIGYKEGKEQVIFEGFYRLSAGDILKICEEGPVFNGRDTYAIPASKFPIPFYALDGIIATDTSTLFPDDWTTIETEDEGLTHLCLPKDAVDASKNIDFYIASLNYTFSDHKSISFAFNNRLYILDGEHFVSVDRDGYVRDVVDTAYVPTTHRNIDLTSTDPLVRASWEYEFRNILTPKYKNSFVPDGEKNVFPMMLGVDKGEVGYSTDTSTNYPATFSVYLDGVRLPWAVFDETGNSYHRPGRFKNAVVEMTDGGVVTLVEAPAKSDSATLVIEAQKKATTISGITTKDTDVGSIITNCTIAALFDNRVFLSGNPEYPKHIFWCAINAETGYPDARYFPIVNYELEGIGDAPVTAMIPVADSLMVLKRESDIEGSVIFHTPEATSDPLYPRIYPSTQGLAGHGCVGAACSFLDDPTFLSEYGLEAMGTLSVRFERAVEHRSSLIDSRLLRCDLERASIVEWEGYLLILCDGVVFMADSRQTYADREGVMQYEWYYLEDIGVWEDGEPEYVYAELPGTVDYSDPDLLESWGSDEIPAASAVRRYDGSVENWIGKTVGDSAEESSEPILTFFYKEKPFYAKAVAALDENGRIITDENSDIQYVYYYVEKTESMTGGVFDPAESLKAIDGDLYFSTKGGVLCKFFFDKRDSTTGRIAPSYYHFNGRRIFSGFATKMDNCGIPHLTKNTVKHSTVIKTRCSEHSSVKIKIRTNKKSFYQLDRIINGTDTFGNLDFADFTFNVDGKNIFAVNEKEKKWVEKQIFVYSDEYCKPFSINYIAYRYYVAGRYKE